MTCSAPDEVHINLMGIAIGNGVIDEATQVCYIIQYKTAQCIAMLWYDMLRYATIWYAMQCDAMQHTDIDSKTLAVSSHSFPSCLHLISIISFYFLLTSLFIITMKMDVGTIDINLQETTYAEYAYSHGLIPLEAKLKAERYQEKCTKKVIVIFNLHYCLLHFVSVWDIPFTVWGLRMSTYCRILIDVLARVESVLWYAVISFHPCTIRWKSTRSAHSHPFFISLVIQKFYCLIVLWRHIVSSTSNSLSIFWTFSVVKSKIQSRGRHHIIKGDLSDCDTM